MRYLLGVDFGGGSSKATLLGEDGKVYAVSSQEYPTYYPCNGWAEQDAEDSYDALVKNIRETLRVSHVKPEQVVALALDAATHTAVLVGADDRPVRRSIYWTDLRSEPQANRLKEDPEIAQECYNTPGSLWTLPQLIWLSENEPDVLAKTRKVMAVKDYLRFRLTGDFVTDRIEAMGFLLFDARRNRWSQRLCSLAGLSLSVLPPVVDPLQKLSPLTAQALEDTGLCAETTVIAGATDTAMEVYAAGAVRPGQATVKLATAGRICAVTDHAVVDPRLVTYRHVVDGLWYPGTATKSCAASNRWYRDTFGGSFESLAREAGQVARGCEGLYFHPYLQGEMTPYLDDKLRASFVGAAAFHTKAHFSRAVMEGVAYSMKDGFATLVQLGIAPASATALGGGAKNPLWRQMLADMLNIPLKTVANADSSLGSAMLAGVACGVFESHQDAVNRCTCVTGETFPDPQGVAFYEERFQTYLAIQKALAPIYHAM